MKRPPGPPTRQPRSSGLPVSLVRQFDTHRLIPSRHLPQSDSVLVSISDDDAHLQAIFELDAATNDRLLASQRLLPGIGLDELVFGVPHAAVIKDRKSTRLNSSHGYISYAVFCLKKKKST